MTKCASSRIDDTGTLIFRMLKASEKAPGSSKKHKFVQLHTSFSLKTTLLPSGINCSSQSSSETGHGFLTIITGNGFFQRIHIWALIHTGIALASSSAKGFLWRSKCEVGSIYQWQLRHCAKSLSKRSKSLPQLPPIGRFSYDVTNGWVTL